MQIWRLANLEGLPADDAPPSARKRYNFSSPREIGRLSELGIDVAGVANNHAEDAGDAGILPAKDLLEKSGVKVCGAGTTQADAVEASPHGVPGCRWRCSPFRPSRARSSMVAKLPDCAERVADAIREAKGEGRAVIVLVHWGTEYSRKADSDQRGSGRGGWSRSGRMSSQGRIRTSFRCWTHIEAPVWRIPRAMLSTRSHSARWRPEAS